MQKKKFDLTSDLVKIDEEIEKVNPEPQIAEKQVKNEEKNILITISIEENIRAEYKSWCARHRLKMNEAFVKGFTLLKEKYGP